MCKMVELLSAPFSLSTGIRSRFEFHGEREGGTAVTDPLRAMIEKLPFVWIPEMEFFSISPISFCQPREMVIEIKCPLSIGEQNSGCLNTL